MSVIKITVNDQALYVTDKPVIASQGVNENYIQCTFSSDWADFGVIALFYKEDNETEVYESVVSGDGKALIPHEVTQTPGRICIGLAGVKGDVVHTSEILKYKIVKGLYTDGEHSEPPSPGIYEQMLALAGQMREAFNTAVTTQGAAIEQIRAEQTALRSELTTEQETFEDRITGQVDTFVAGHSGTYGQTTLWTSPDENGIIGKDATVTLSEPIESFDYVDIYSFNGDKNELAIIPVDNALLQGDGYAIRTVNVSTGTVKMDIVESRITIVGTVFTIANEYIYQAGQSNPVHQITQDNKSPHVGTYGITKVVGRKLVENAEVADIRVGADGTVYPSAGAAVRGQITEVKAQIPLIDASLATTGKAADAKAVGDELTELNERLDSLGDGVPTEVRQALLTLFQSAAYAETGLTDEIAVIASWAAIVTAISLNQSSISINGANTNQLVATTTPAGGVVTWASSDTSVATVANGLVTGVGNGTATITASCGGKHVTCSVTVSGFATLSSISAVYTQGGTVYDTDTLDSLKSDLVVTATYSDSTTRTLSDSDYVLSGTLSVGTSAITVAYGGKTTTFNVTVSEPSHIVALKGYSLGPASGDSNMWISSQAARACLVNDVGDHPYAYKSGVSFDVDYYPIPIPSGATSMVVTMPSELYVGVRTCAWNGSQYNGSGLSSPWTAAADATFDVSSYNDGTHFALFTFKIGTAGSSSMVNYDMSGVSVSFT